VLALSRHTTRTLADRANQIVYEKIVSISGDCEGFGGLFAVSRLPGL
jgi:hypothetical protein